MFSKIILSTMLLASVGCVHLNSLSVSPIPENRSKPVTAIESKLIFFGFNFDNDFISAVPQSLESQCPQGKVTGLLTKDEDINYFLYFVWRKQITATGYCVNPGAVKAASATSEPASRRK